MRAISPGRPTDIDICNLLWLNAVPAGGCWRAFDETRLRGSLLGSSPRHSEARQKEIGVILALGDLGSKRMPYVLVTGDQLDGRCDRKIVEHLNAALVTRSGRSQRKLRGDVRLQIVADPIVVESNSETIVFPSAEETL